jgi:hypothetical protein
MGAGKDLLRRTRAGWPYETLRGLPRANGEFYATIVPIQRPKCNTYALHPTNHPISLLFATWFRLKRETRCFLHYSTRYSDLLTHERPCYILYNI